jgi:hypothetical protein
MGTLQLLATGQHCCATQYGSGARLDNIQLTTLDRCAHACAALPACHFVSFSGTTRTSGRGSCTLCAACALKPTPKVSYVSYARRYREGAWGCTNDTTCGLPRPSSASWLPPGELVGANTADSERIDTTVAISLPVYESETWVELLLRNTLMFARRE